MTEVKVQLQRSPTKMRIRRNNLICSLWTFPCSWGLAHWNYYRSWTDRWRHPPKMQSTTLHIQNTQWHM